MLFSGLYSLMATTRVSITLFEHRYRRFKVQLIDTILLVVHRYQILYFLTLCKKDTVFESLSPVSNICHLRN